MLRLKSTEGQTLLEVVIALGVAVMVVALITIAVLNALDNATYSKNQNLATQISQEAMEIVRQKRDTDIAGFNLLSGSYCLAKGSTTLVQKQTDCGQNVDIFKREVAIYQSSSPQACPPSPPTTTLPLVKAVASVFWSDSKCPASDVFCHKIELVSCLSN